MEPPSRLKEPKSRGACDSPDRFVAGAPVDLADASMVPASAAVHRRMVREGLGIDAALRRSMDAVVHRPTAACRACSVHRAVDR